MHQYNPGFYGVPPMMNNSRDIPSGYGGAITEVNNNDVLSGRGGRINSHPGNIRFRELVAQFKPIYLAKSTKKLDKAKIADEIVQRIRNQIPPGRFLKEDPRTSIWEEIGDERARKKAGQAMRENADDTRRELEKQEFTGELPNTSVPYGTNAAPPQYSVQPSLLDNKLPSMRTFMEQSGYTTSPVRRMNVTFGEPQHMHPNYSPSLQHPGHFFNQYTPTYNTSPQSQQFNQTYNTSPQSQQFNQTYNTSPQSHQQEYHDNNSYDPYVEGKEQNPEQPDTKITSISTNNSSTTEVFNKRFRPVQNSDSSISVLGDSLPGSLKNSTSSSNKSIKDNLGDSTSLHDLVDMGHTPHSDHSSERRRQFTHLASERSVSSYLPSQLTDSLPLAGTSMDFGNSMRMGNAMSMSFRSSDLAPLLKRSSSFPAPLPMDTSIASFHDSALLNTLLMNSDAEMNSSSTLEVTDRKRGISDSTSELPEFPLPNRKVLLRYSSNTSSGSKRSSGASFNSKTWMQEYRVAPGIDEFIGGRERLLSDRSMISALDLAELSPDLNER